MGGFIWQLPNILDLLDRDNGLIPFTIVVVFFAAVALAGLYILWKRTPITEKQLDEMLKIARTRLGLPSEADYRQNIEDASELREGK